MSILPEMFEIKDLVRILFTHCGMSNCKLVQQVILKRRWKCPVTRRAVGGRTVIRGGARFKHVCKV